VHVETFDVSSEPLIATNFDPALLTAFRGTKGHSHQISDRHRAFAKIEKPIAGLDAAFRQMTGCRYVIVSIALARPMVGGKPTLLPPALHATM